MYITKIWCYIIKLRYRVNKEDFGWGINVFSFVALTIGSMGPDLIDKPISEPIFGYGRFIGHSLLFDFVISIVILAIFRKRKKIALAFVLGWQMHLILDSGGFMPWFYPFVNYDFQERTVSFLEYLTRPEVYGNEIAGFLRRFIKQTWSKNILTSKNYAYFKITV